ncbi:hypothetical protein [Litchfieldia alkalitelluris]|uniref:hypothetical protein n=1 Tax=Litchfieldia alkalitelluris TaxID=304268 RepID=UPI001116ACF9|nr:hypothetical protein [Litchfieldia alkalitelluris]
MARFCPFLAAFLRWESLREDHPPHFPSSPPDSLSFRPDFFHFSPHFFGGTLYVKTFRRIFLHSRRTHFLFGPIFPISSPHFFAGALSAKATRRIYFLFGPISPISRRISSLGLSPRKPHAAFSFIPAAFLRWGSLRESLTPHFPSNPPHLLSFWPDFPHYSPHFFAGTLSVKASRRIFLPTRRIHFLFGPIFPITRRISMVDSVREDLPPDFFGLNHS